MEFFSIFVFCKQESQKQMNALVSEAQKKSGFVEQYSLFCT
jgi:ribosomal silencing factor RsfS